MKAKTKKRLIIWLIILITVSIIGYFGYRSALVFVGDKAMNMLLENQLNSMLDNGEITLDELEAIAESDPTANAAPAPQEEPIASESPAEEKQNAETKQESSQKPQQQQTATTSAEKPAEQTQAKTAERKETVKKAADNIGFGITRADKEEMAKLITKRLSGSDISYLASLLSGGLTRNERRKAYEIAKARFSGDELAEVSRFYHKYKKAIMIEPDGYFPEDFEEENQAQEQQNQ